MNSKILTAPDGSLLRVAHIVSVSPLFEHPELECHCFAVYTTASPEPFTFAANQVGTGPKAISRRNEDTAIEHKRFIDAWVVSLDGSQFFKN